MADSLDSLPSLSDNVVLGEVELGNDEDDDGIHLTEILEITTTFSHPLRSADLMAREQLSCPPSNGVWAPSYSICKRAQGPSRELYDRKRRQSHTAPIKELLPAVPACLREAKVLWEKTLTSRIFAKGTPSLAHHTSPMCCVINNTSASLPLFFRKLTWSWPKHLELSTGPLYC